MRYLNSALTVCLERYPDWPMMLPLVLFAYRTMPHATTGYSPYFLLFGREPKLPLDVLSSPPRLGEVFDDDARTYLLSAKKFTDDVSKKLRKAFRQVRHAQDACSVENAARRDVGRQSVRYEPDDLVLVHDPKSKSSSDGEARTEVPPSFIGVPFKWRFKYSGPHKIIERINDNVYLVLFKSGHKRSVNVDRLLKYYPYSGPDVLAESPAGNVPAHLSQEPARPVTSAPRDPKVKKIDDLASGDLCLLKFDDPNEPMVVSRFLAATGGPPNGTGFLFQWMGGFFCRNPIERLKTKKWLNGWIAPTAKYYYWKAKRTHPSHNAYTNARTDHAVERAAILLAGFGLQADGKFPKQLIPVVEKLWASHGANPQDAPDAEDPDADDAPMAE
jgi:hypothetical protein